MNTLNSEENTGDLIFTRNNVEFEIQWLSVQNTHSNRVTHERRKKSHPLNKRRERRTVSVNP